ncbi:MAG TPA: hypothetical protein VIY48_09700 [Candidatus Paceibacterota bacterium]
MTAQCSESTYNPLAYAPDPVWLEWIAAEYEAVAAGRDFSEAIKNANNEQTYAAEYRMFSAGGYEVAARAAADELETSTEYELTNVAPNPHPSALLQDTCIVTKSTYDGDGVTAQVI